MNNTQTKQIDNLQAETSDPLDRSAILDVAMSLAQRIGSTVLGHTMSGNSSQINFKSRKDIVTEMDVWAEQEIFREVSSLFPNHILIGEESASRFVAERKQPLKEILSNGICWIVDPIDGTANFANRIPHYAISIGVTFNGVRQVGVVYDPPRNELFYAQKGAGAFLNGEQIFVGTKTDLLDCVIATGSPADIAHALSESAVHSYEAGSERLERKVRCIRKFGAAALDFCWVACGRLDACIHPLLQPWDVAAGTLIAEEAGARVSHFLGDQTSFDLTSQSFHSANSFIFDAVDKCLA